MQRSRLKIKPNIWDMVAIVVMGLLLVGYLYNLTGWRIFDDEGEYLYQVWRMADGAIPYKDFLTPQLPVFLYSGTAVMALGSGELWTMRLFSVLLAFTTASLLLVYGRKQHHVLTGLLAAVLFLLHSDVFKETRIFRNEPLFLALITAGLVIATWSTNKPKTRQLIISGIFFGLATLVKLFGLLPVGGVAAWLIWDTWRNKRPTLSFVKDILLLLGPLVLTILSFVLIFSLVEPRFLDLVLGHHLEQGSDQSLFSVLASKFDLYRTYIGLYPLFVIFAIISGTMGLITGDGRERWFWQIPTVLGFLFLSRELGQRHFMYLLPVMALLVGWLLANGFMGEFRWWGRLASGILLLAIIIPWLRPNIDRAQWQDNETEKLVKAIDEYSSPGATILADDIGLAFYSERPTTYSGAALSHGATTSGQITGEILISEIMEENVEVVIVDESLLTGNHMIFLRDYPRFHRFLENNFVSVDKIRRDYQELAIWAREPDREWLADDTLDIQYKIDERPWFGETFRLVGYSFEQDNASSGNQFKFTLYWHSEEPADNYWSVFTHLVAQDGALIAQDDKVPYEGLYPPNRWWSGQIIDDSYKMQIPEGIQPGEYELVIGMYDHLSGDRLTLRSAAGLPLTDDQYRLPATITIEDN